jgi:phosphotransacetylase
VEILKERDVNFEFDGDMQPDVALSSDTRNFILSQKLLVKQTY